MKLSVLADRTTTIRASVNDVQISLLLSIALVIMVIFLFLRRFWPTFIANVTVPLALAGTCGIMYLLNYSLDNLSLMAITISVGFVVDDAIVVIENIYRYIEKGQSSMDAALNGARQIGFTVISISTSLVAVFIPLLFMGGLVGRLFHEFAVTLSLAVLVSGIVSLTLTPMMCSRFLNRIGVCQTQWVLPGVRKDLRLGARSLRNRPQMGAPAPELYASGCPGNRHRDCLALHRGAQRVFPATGYRGHVRNYRGRSGRFLHHHGPASEPSGPDRSR